MLNTQQSSSTKYWLIAAAFCGAVGGVFWYTQQKTKTGIVGYEASRDRAFEIDIFKKNWYWLLSDYSPHYNLERLLDYRTPDNDDLTQAGKLLMYTYLSEGKPAGFIHFYEKELRIGQILFLAVHDDYRKKGYARELMNFAIKELKKRGMLTIRMNTRTDNTKARALYENLGFKQIWTDGAYIIYELIP